MADRSVLQLTGFVAVAVLALLVLLGQPRVAHAATITVCASGCDHMTLGGAIAAAGSGDVIKLGAETYPVTSPVIAKDLTIEGDGPDVSIIDLGDNTGFYLNDDFTLTLRALGTTGGVSAAPQFGAVVFADFDTNLTIDNVHIAGARVTDTQEAPVYGNGGSTVLIVDSRITGTTSVGGGAPAAYGSSEPR